MKKLPKNVRVCAVVILVASGLLFSAFVLKSWYWGRRHKLNFDIQRITYTQTSDTVYDIKIEGTAKRWWYDFTGYHDIVFGGPSEGGESRYRICSVSAQPFSVSFGESTFCIDVTIDTATEGWGYGKGFDALKDYVEGTLRFNAYSGTRTFIFGKQGITYEDGINIYMSDDTSFERVVVPLE